MNIRVAQEDFSLRLDGERSAAVRKGDIIALYPQSMHLDPDIYEEPQVPLTTIINLPINKDVNKVCFIRFYGNN